jgi:hypothetical protein
LRVASVPGRDRDVPEYWSSADALAKIAVTRLVTIASAKKANAVKPNLRDLGSGGGALDWADAGPGVLAAGVLLATSG